MNENKYISLIQHFSTILDSSFDYNQSSNSIFTAIKSIIDFDNAYIAYLSSDNFKISYVSNINDKRLNQVIYLNTKLKNELFSTENKILNADNKVIKLLELNENKSFIITKLIIKNTTYGFILLCKSDAEFYTKEDLEISSAIGSIISYKIKDIELSDVFKSQIKALAGNVVEIKAADKIKTEFLANISHELRTPLNAIIGFSEILKNGFYGKLNEKQTDFVDDIHISGIHLLGMINELLDISKIEAGAMNLNKTKFKIDLLVNEVVNVVAPLAIKKQIKIVTSIKYNKEIIADYQKIKQILYNLISNAIKFSPENDSIEIQIFKEKSDLFIQVNDHGVGIALENHKKIFDKFVQLENSLTKTESSTGLGLTITKKLVQLHNGTITVKSELGKGATFIVKLPCAD